MKVALLDRRSGSHGGKDPNAWRTTRNEKIVSLTPRGENTFSIINAFDDVLSGSIENGTTYGSILSEYDIIIIRVRHPAEELPAITRLRAECPKPKIIVYTDEWVNYKTEDLHKHKFKEVSETVDAIICGFGKAYQKEIFDGMGIKNYHHLPYAGDVGYWKQWYKPYSKKSKYVVGMWHLRSFIGQGSGNANHTDTFKVFKHINDNYPDIKCKFFLNFDGHKQEAGIRKQMIDMGLDCELLTHIPNTEFNKIMAKAYLFYEEYPTPAFSRATVVSACVGTPSISNYLNDPSRICFPDLTVENKDIDNVKLLVDKLLTDKIFWKNQANQGRDNVEYYNYPAFKDRIIQLVNTI